MDNATWVESASNGKQKATNGHVAQGKSQPIPLLETLIDRSVEKMLPLRVIFELTYKCNIACDFCYLAPRPTPELTTEECKMVIDQLKDEGCLFLTFTGGEPLIRNDFFELAEYARSRFMAIEVKTNGVLVTEERAKRFKELSVMNVDVSIHGSTADMHDSITLRPGSWEKTLQGIRFLREQDVMVTMKCPLTRMNFDDRRNIKALCESLGCDCVFDMSMTARQDGDMSPHKHKITQAQLEEFIEQHEQDYLASVMTCTGPVELSELKKERPCNAGISTASVNPYGDVFPCIQLYYKIGNIRQNTFHDIWLNSPAVNRLRSIRFGDLTECNACANVVHCLRCPGLALLEDGDLLGRSSEACRQAEAYRRVKAKHDMGKVLVGATKI